MTKHISRGLEIARHNSDEAKPKSVTIRILKPKHDTSSVVIAGKVAKHGDLADVTEYEAHDLIHRGRAELAA